MRIFIPSINEGTWAMATEKFVWNKFSRKPRRGEAQGRAEQKNEGIFDNLSSFLQGGIAQRRRLGDGRKAAK